MNLLCDGLSFVKASNFDPSHVLAKIWLIAEEQWMRIATVVRVFLIGLFQHCEGPHIQLTAETLKLFHLKESGHDFFSESFIIMHAKRIAAL